MINFKILSVLLICILTFGQKTATAQSEKYSRVRIYCNEKQLQELHRSGIPVDHGNYRKGVWLETDLSEKEITIVTSKGIKTELLIDDVQAFYVNRNLEKGNPETDFEFLSGCNTSGPVNYTTPSDFTLGSMGGFFTYSEFISHLDNMFAKYPNLITQKQPIDTFKSIEGRPIYWLKISDNPNTDETEPEVLYTALHHAREPESLSQLIFYMYYLLENYNSNSEIKALVDNTEMYFIPMINPDGYIYNHTTNPNGGGMWRKNKRDNDNNGSFNSQQDGVDLNRNYGYFWGLDDTGSSPDPTEDTYRGDSAFSEPEIQAVKYFATIRPIKMALNYHTYGNLLIYPWGYAESIYTPDSAIFVEYAKIMTSENNFTYGTGDQTVGYIVNGDSDDWFYGEQQTKPKILSMTPEAGPGSSGFWPQSSSIIPLAKDNLYQNLMFAKLAGKYAKVEDSSPASFSSINGNLSFKITRLGLGSPATFTVSVTPLTSGLVITGGPKVYTGMSLLEQKTDSFAFVFNNNSVDTFAYVISVNNGLYTEFDTITKTYGLFSATFNDNGNNINNWQSSSWNTTTSQYYSPSSSITDSPTGKYQNNTSTTITLKNPVDLLNASNALLSFWAKWDIEAGYDYVQVQASDNNGISWTSLCGKYTKPGSQDQDEGQPLYDGLQNNWVYEEINLKDYIGKQIKIRFRLISDGWLNKDGYYFDDLSVSVVLNTGNSELNLSQIAVGQNSPNPASDITTINHAFVAEEGQIFLDLFDVTGKTVLRQALFSGTTTTSVNISNLSEGIYYYRIINGDLFSETKKMAIIR